MPNKMTPNYYDMEKNQNCLQVPKRVGTAGKIGTSSMKNVGKIKPLKRK